jgi:glycosyltransferase involved in cell wall biosynthesis
MKILLIDKFHYIKGGAQTYYFTLKKILEQNGHEVAVFSMKDDKNESSIYEKYFIEHIDYNQNNNLIVKLKQAFKMIYSKEAAKKLDQLIREFNPDIAHIHVFQHHLSSSIIRTLKKRNIPMIHTVHDLKIICPNYKMLNDQGICQKCHKSKFYQCTLNKCIKNSYLKSFLGTIEAYFSKLINTYKKIDMYIMPSKFYESKFLEFGFNQEKMHFLPNFLVGDEFTPKYQYGSYFSYIGRLSEEKGIITLLKSMKDVKGHLKVIGTGPLEEKLKELIVELKLENRVELVGFKSNDELKELINHSQFIVVPSEWYENAPYTILEALALGKVIIGADIGGIPEFIEEGRNGFLFEAGNELDLVNKINLVINQEELLLRMSKHSRSIFEERYNDEAHYQEIMKFYKEVLYSPNKTSKFLSLEA